MSRRTYFTTHLVEESYISPCDFSNKEDDVIDYLG